MPSYVIAELLGLPLEDGVRLYDLTETIHSVPDPANPGAGMTAAVEMLQYAHGVWEERRANPGDDLASKLAHSSVDGVPMSEGDFGLYFLLLIDAGGDTTRNLVATGMHALLTDHPDQLEFVAADLDGRLNVASEELLRWVSPVVYMRRTATQATQLGRQSDRRRRQSRHLLRLGERDESVFKDPTRFDVTRWPNEHVAFGGRRSPLLPRRHLGRAEIQAMLREILTRLDGAARRAAGGVVAVQLHLRGQASRRSSSIRRAPNGLSGAARVFDY